MLPRDSGAAVRPPGPERGKRRRIWPDDYVVVRILRELFELNTKGEGATIHQLSTLRGMPTQRDERIKGLLEYLCGQGLVTKMPVGERTIYRISDKGVKFWVRFGDGFGIFRPLHEPDVSP